MESNVDPPAPLAPVEFKRARPGHQRAQGKSVERARRNGRLLPVGGLARLLHQFCVLGGCQGLGSSTLLSTKRVGDWILVC